MPAPARSFRRDALQCKSSAPVPVIPLAVGVRVRIAQTAVIGTVLEIFTGSHIAAPPVAIIRRSDWDHMRHAVLVADLVALP